MAIEIGLGLGSRGPLLSTFEGEDRWRIATFLSARRRRRAACLEDEGPGEVEKEGDGEGVGVGEKGGRESVVVVEEFEEEEVVDLAAFRLKRTE